MDSVLPGEDQVIAWDLEAVVEWVDDVDEILHIPDE